MVNLEWPWILLLLPLPWLIGFWHDSRFGSDRSQNTDAIKVTPRLRKALDDTSAAPSGKRRQYFLLLWLAWITLLLAISRPTIPNNTEAQAASGRTLAMVIDLSASMERKDFTMDGVSVDRLSVVKRIAGEFIQNRVGDRVGLILFGEEAFLGSPPSFDLESIRHELLNSGIGMAGRTTAIGDALGLAIQSLRSDSAPEKAIILLSDGTNNAGSAEPESAAQLAGELSIRIHTIGLGSEALGSDSDQLLYTSAAADLDETTLKAVASASGGSFFRARSSTELEEIYQEINQLEGGDTTAPPIIVHQDLRNVLVLLLLFLMALQVLVSFKHRRAT